MAIPEVRTIKKEANMGCQPATPSSTQKASVELTGAELAGQYHRYGFIIDGKKYLAINGNGDGEFRPGFGLDSMIVERTEWVYNPLTKRHDIPKDLDQKVSSDEYKRAVIIARMEVEKYRSGLLGKVEDAVKRLKKNLSSDKLMGDNYCYGKRRNDHVIKGADVTIHDYDNDGNFDSIDFHDGKIGVRVSTVFFSCMFACIEEHELHDSVLTYLDIVNKWMGKNICD